MCLDEADVVWVVLHSGSRGVGKELAEAHIARAKSDFDRAMFNLDDPDLAWFVQGTVSFDEYVADMLWAQAYAKGNRDAMMNAALIEVFASVGKGSEVERINCHHNFCQREEHNGRDVWVTRKGAIQADTGVSE